MSTSGSLSPESVGTVTFRIKDSAKDGTYNIGAIVQEAVDGNGNAVSGVSVSGGSVTVKGNSPTTPPVTTPPVTNPPVTNPPVTNPPVTNPPVTTPPCTHANTSWKETKAATCTTEGEKQKICDACGQVLETKVIPALGHDKGEWAIIQEATETEDGLKQLKCTRCHEVLKEEIIPYITTEMRYNQTVCSLGIRFRDVNPNLTNKWFMFTPIDLSKDGTQTVDLIAANITYVGKATVKVSGDQVTVSYHLNWPVEIKDMQFALISNLDSVKDADIKTMKTYSFGQEISIANDLGGDTKVLLYVLGHINYDFKDASKELFIPNGAGYQKLVKQLQEIMD